MVLKDAFCSECGREAEVYFDMGARETEKYCPLCDDVQIFYSKCTGGAKSRWRYVDWEGYDATGCIETESTSITHVVDGKEEPLPHKTHGTMDNYNRKYREEKDDKFRFNYKKKYDKLPKTFDTKSKT